MTVPPITDADLPMTRARAVSDAEWIAARKALSLARRELNTAMLTLPYDRLGELAPLRRRHDEAQRYVETLRATRKETAGAMFREVLLLENCYMRRNDAA